MVRIAIACATLAMLAFSASAMLPFLGRPAQAMQRPGFGGGIGGFSGACSGLSGIGGFSFGGNFSGASPCNIGGGLVGAFGGFVLATPERTVTTREDVPVFAAWFVPAPGVWRDISSLQVRLRDVHTGDVAMWILFDEATSTFGLIHPSTGELRGRPRQPGDGGLFSTQLVTMDLSQSAVEGSGPAGESVALLLPFRFKVPAAGREFYVEIGATHDSGAVEPFAAIGTLKVAARR